MKAILMSIKPQHVANILNGLKTIEIRKKFPSDYVGWVYIYYTKAPLKNCSMNDIAFYCMGSGKVVARFWCDKVEEIIYGITNDTKNCPKEDQEFDLQTETLNDKELKEQSCLTYNELHNYFEKEFNTSDNYFKTVFGKAIHITKLEIFDKPKELKEFRPYCDRCFSINNKCLNCKAYMVDIDLGDWCNKNKLALTRAPQSWCFIEIGE